jgi:asparagine synthase (glutamine-hydrolysing)
VKQLYFAKSAPGLAFGSELKAILASGLIKPEVDESSILAYLTLFYCPEPRTLIKGIGKLSPGSWMRLRPGRQEEVVRYYEVPTTPRLEAIDLEEAATRTRRLLWRSVELQLQADVPVGISLSGGVDSSAIACAAVHHQRAGAAPIALTIHWPDTAPDEVVSARELCDHLSMRQEILEIPVANLLEDLPLLGWMSDEPVADPAIYSQFCIAREAAKHVKVLLGGAGGDELFGGYGSYKLSRRYAAFNSLPRAMQQRILPWLAGNWMTEDSLVAMMPYAESRYAWHAYTKSNLTLRQQATLAKTVPGSRSPFSNFQELFSRYKNYDPADQQMIVDLHTYLPEQILTMTDRATMAASIEGRVPFLDGPLVDFAFSLPVKIKMGATPAGKLVLKRAIAADVSPSILQRKKAGMPSPFVSFLTEHLGVLRHIVFSRESYVRSILPEDWLRDMTANKQSARASFCLLYAILTLEIWHKLFVRDQVYTKPNVSTVDLFKIPTSALSS